tara:strand:+ start:425 stop:727 length:303 start_codon:yes stop_codon:yes gene_type:complete
MEWMLHADHTYEKHPHAGFVANIDGRGAGAEFRLLGTQHPALAAPFSHRVVLHLKPGMSDSLNMKQIVSVIVLLCLWASQAAANPDYWRHERPKADFTNQ